MATKAHCAYCFEVLSAHFENRQPLSLELVQQLWDRYHASTSSEPQGDDIDGGLDGRDVHTTGTGAGELPTGRPAAISRLLNRDTSNSAASSSSSLPSMPSRSSSTPSRGEESGVNTPASSSSSVSNFKPQPLRQEEHPLFVTWNTISRSSQKSLRGCIGTFEPLELEYGLKSYAMTSALEDTRFSPIAASLLPSLSNHVTLLTNFSQPTRDPLDWTLGTHGIRISFTLNGRRYGATYLPDVAKEQGWTKDETLISLMRKAGWSGSSSAWLKIWRDGNGELVRYEGKAVGLEYAEWREWRDWAEKADGKS